MLGCLGFGLTLMYTSSCSISWVMRPATPHITHQHQVGNLSVTQVHISARNTNTRIRTYLQERMHTASPSDFLLVVNLSPVLTVHLLTMVTSHLVASHLVATVTIHLATMVTSHLAAMRTVPSRQHLLKQLCSSGQANQATKK